MDTYTPPDYNTKVDKIRLVREASTIERVKITSSLKIENFIRNIYGDDLTIYESFYIVLLNNSNTTIGFARISQGGITGTLVDVRLVLKYVLDTLAVSVILAHNHPSGTLRPSQADKDITKKLKNTLQLLDVTVLDHIILTETSYFSFADENIL
tara:strand:+ start:82 stop:543 length:462 start_codon:yes stop_codon:yes gene_type:complete